MARREHGQESLRRLYSKQRKLSTSKARLPWRHRAKRIALRKTPAEKAAQAAKRQAHRVSYREALTSARSVVMDQAIQLRERFGMHTVEWYFEEIMQQSRMGKVKRAPSRWNAFLRKEVQRINNGMYISTMTKSQLICFQLVQQDNPVSNHQLS